jgi:DNA-binding transcriptional MerR regulator
MNSKSIKPSFNLKAVVQETGIKPDTLRAWERRYGLPTPNRTDGGHRLFTQRDIDTVKWLLSRQEEGLSISRAVNLWQSLEAEGKDPLFEMAYGDNPTTETPAIQPGDAIEIYRSEWIDACKRFDEQAAQHILNQAFAIYSQEVVVLELITKALAEIGEAWYRSEITIQQEHFASALATRRIEALISATPAPTRPGRVLVLCPPGEEHTFSPLLITFFIKRNGYEALFLGANVPLERLNESIQSVNPDLAILTAQQLHTAASLLTMAEQINQRQVAVAFGGRIFNMLPELQEKIPGTFLGTQLDTVPQVVGRLLRNPKSQHNVRSPDPELIRAEESFRIHRPQIEMQVWEQLSDQIIQYSHISIANQNLAKNIESALRLGDISYLGPDIDWVSAMLGNHGLPDELVQIYLLAYRDALGSIMGTDGQVVESYLTELLKGEVEVE